MQVFKPVATPGKKRNIRVSFTWLKTDLGLVKQITLETQKDINYRRIARAIDYLAEHFKEQPSLDQVASHVNLSPFHFQRLFADWAGTTPKKFLQYLSADYAKKLLRENDATLGEAACHTGLSGTGRLHDLFVKLEGMTPAEYKQGGRSLLIHYCFAQTPFGGIILASTGRGICYLAFMENEAEALDGLKARFPNAAYVQHTDAFQQSALAVFARSGGMLPPVKLHLKGTAFQLKVWEALLKVPAGGLVTYGTIARRINLPAACRAVGTAVGSNPVSFLIPCHRVIQASGVLGSYRWGSSRKRAIIGWEASNVPHAPGAGL